MQEVKRRVFLVTEKELNSEGFGADLEPGDILIYHGDIPSTMVLVQDSFFQSFVHSSDCDINRFFTVT
jgi:hypothetical protein